MLELLKTYEMAREDWYILWMVGVPAVGFIVYKVAEKKECESLKFLAEVFPQIAVMGAIGKLIWETCDSCLTIW